MSEQIIPYIVISMPSQQFMLSRKFQPASNGKIYIGNVDTDPKEPNNQIQVYIENEDGSLIASHQPININAAGYPVYNGQIAKFVTDKAYSMAVLDSYGTQQFYFSNILKYNPDQLEVRLNGSNGASLIGTKSGKTVQQKLDDLPSEVDAAGTAEKLIIIHNDDYKAHPELSKFITSEADRAEAAANNATVNADVYPDIETGLASVEDGQQFQVNNDDVITRYRRESETSAVEVASLFNKNGILNKIHPLRLPNMFEDGGLKSGVKPTLKTSASTYQLSDLVEITDPYLKSIGCVNGVKPTGNYKNQILTAHTIPTDMYGKYVLMSAIVYSGNGEFGHISNCSFLGDASTANMLSLSYENSQRDISPTLRCYATLVKIPSDGSAISMHIGKANLQNAENAYITSICYVFSEGKLSLDEIKWDSPYSANDEFDRGIEESMLGFKKNVISWGGLDGGNKNPAIRSGSEIVKLSSQRQLTDRGYTNALRWRSGNEFVGYSENYLSGKYAGGYFLIYAENKDDVQNIVGADILCNSSSSVANIQRINRGVEVISKNLYLVWFSGFIDKDNVNQLWLGSSVAPITTSRYATDFSLFIDDEPLDMWPIIRRISQINQTKLMIEQYSGDGIEPTKKSTVSLLGVDGISSVKCNNDTRIERQFILRKSESVTASTVFNFTKDIINDVVLREMVDDVAPYRTFGTTIGANHGYFMSLVTTSAAHGKSASDVGSVYTNG
nr:hypothetical protein [Providencia rettgeri]